MKRFKIFLIAVFITTSTLLSPPGSTQPIRKQNCPGVYEFYGHPDPHSGLRILYVMAGRQEALTTCWSRIGTRMGGAAPLNDYLIGRGTSAADQRLLKETAAQLGF